MFLRSYVRSFFISKSASLCQASLLWILLLWCNRVRIKSLFSPDVVWSVSSPWTRVSHNFADMSSISTARKPAWAQPSARRGCEICCFVLFFHYSMCHALLFPCYILGENHHFVLYNTLSEKRIIKRDDWCSENRKQSLATKSLKRSWYSASRLLSVFYWDILFHDA